MYNKIKELVAIPSITGEKAEEGMPFGKNVYEALTYVLDLCKSFGFKTKNCDGYIGWAEIGEGDQMIGILCHLDVVPPGENWIHGPFSGEIEEGKIYGRGVLDDKGPAITAVYAMKDLLDSGIELKKRIRIIFGCQEETGDWTDMDYYKEHEELPSFGFTPDADFPAIYGEMGIAMINLVMPKIESGIEYAEGGQATNMVPSYAKAIVSGKEFEAVGVAAHGSTPWEGENAISKLMKQIEDCNPKCSLAKFYNEKIGNHLHGEKIGLELFDDASGMLSFNVGKIYEEKDFIKLAVDIRFPVTYTVEEVITRLEEEVRPFGLNVEIITDMKPVYMDKNGKVISTLMEAYREVTNDKTEASVMGGGTYARAMDNIIAFGPVFPGRECTEHCADEYIYIEDLEKMRKIYRLALEKLM